MTATNTRTAPAWLVEGATVAVTYRGAFTNRDRGVELHTVSRVGKATITLSTGDKYSIGTLSRVVKGRADTIATLADPEDRMIQATLKRQERETARSRIHKAYDAFQKMASPERTQALMDQLAAYQALQSDGQAL